MKPILILALAAGLAGYAPESHATEDPAAFYVTEDLTETCLLNAPDVEPPQTISYCKKALEAAGTAKQAFEFHIQTALAYKALGRKGKSRSTVKKAIAENPGYEALVESLEHLSLYDMHTQAIDVVNALIALENKSDDWLRRCELYTELHDIDKALRDCEMAYTLSKETSFHWRLAYTYNLAKRPEDALRVIDQGLLRVPKSETLLVEKAWAIAISGDRAGAIAFAERAYEQLPHSYALPRFVETAKHW